jgi:hypothetical protein
MDKTNVMEETYNYFEKEYQDIKEILADKPNWVVSEKGLVDNAIQRCLGVAIFAQNCGVSYQTVLVYERYKEKLKKLLK